MNFQDSKGRTALMHSALSTQMIQLTKTDQKWQVPGLPIARPYRRSLFRFFGRSFFRRQISDLSTAKGLAATWNTQVEAARSQETNRSLITRFLVHHPLVDVNIVDHDGRSVVHFAVISGNCQLLALLLCRHDVNLNVADRNGDSPLMYAPLIDSSLLATLYPAPSAVCIKNSSTLTRNRTIFLNSGGQPVGVTQFTTAIWTSPA